MSKLSRDNAPPQGHQAVPEGGLAWDSLLLWLLSWTALLLGADWLESDAPRMAPRPAALQDEATPEDARSRSRRGQRPLPVEMPAPGPARGVPEGPH